MASAISPSPALGPRQSSESTPAPVKQRSLSRMRSIQNVNTSIPQMVSITPASAHSSSSLTPSPYLGSIQSSPSVGFPTLQTSQLATPNPFELPESIVAHPAPRESQPGLIRKASNTFRQGRDALRRKASTTQRKAETSTGPITRRRSDSKTVGVNSNAADYASFDDEPFEVPLTGLQIYDAMSITSEPVTLELGPEGQAPTIPEQLVSGMLLQKVTKSKTDTTLFSLDPQGSRVSWRGKLSIKSFHIDNIKSIRRGEEAATSQKELKGEAPRPELCFTINYAASDSSNRAKSLNLAAKTSQDVDAWVETLETLAKHREDLMTTVMGTTEREDLIKTHWDNEMKQKSKQPGSLPEERLDLAAIQRLCERLHIHSPPKDLETAFRYADPANSESLDYAQFKTFVRHLRERKDLSRVFHLINNGQASMSIDAFLEFLVSHQGFDLSDENVKSLWLERANRLADLSRFIDDSHPSERRIDVEGFVSFMSSKDSRVYAQAAKATPKLDRPLSEYFISSSHNTYLTGWQVAGNSSAEAYVTALRRGCRCVEVDCWDGPDENPRVTHGRTRTTSVPFYDCIVAINKWAFDASPYPLAISLEVHCNPEQQRKMYNTMREIFGEKLILSPLGEDEATLPSPEDLKYRILVKVKATDATPNIPQLQRKRSTSSPHRKAMTSASVANVSALATLPSPSLTSPAETIYSPTDRSTAATSASSAGEESDGPVTSPKVDDGSKRKVSKITPLLSSLGVYMQGYTLRDEDDLVFQKYNHIFSINEDRAVGFCQKPESKTMFENHNVSNLCRIYPRNLRFQSSNFDPNTFWRRGVQMVALNWQTYDAHMQMNHAMFAAGVDQYGYVLKPEYLRVPRSKRVNEFEARRKLPKSNVSFSVRIISAQQLPRPQNINKNEALNPFIEMQMFCAEDRARNIARGAGGFESSDPSDRYGIGAPYRRRTKVVLGNGWNPQFDEAIDLSLQTKYPELVFVRFVVYNAPDGKPYGKNCKQIAVFTAKLSSLQKGYRHIPLYNGHGEEFIFSTLFCHVAKHPPKLLPDALTDKIQRTPRARFYQSLFSRGISGDRARDRSTSLGDRSTSIDEDPAEEMKLKQQKMLVNKEIIETIPQR